MKEARRSEGPGTLSSEDREFVFIQDKLTEIESRIGELRSTTSGQGMTDV
jgi:hypothetical protein